MALILLSGAPALAQVEPLNPEVTGGISLMTDYRFRGYSRSDGDPAARASIDTTTQVTDRTGLFVGASVAGFSESGRYGHVEVDPYAGLAREFGAVHVEFGGRGYLFPDARDRDYYELFSSARLDLGPVSTKIGAAFAPRQRNYGDRRGLYLYTDIESGVPRTPLTIVTHLGWEDNGLIRNKLDWELKLLYVRGPLSLGIGYVDTNRFIPSAQGDRLRNGAGATPIVTLDVTF